MRALQWSLFVGLQKGAREVGGGGEVGEGGVGGGVREGQEGWDANSRRK